MGSCDITADTSKGELISEELRNGLCYITTKRGLQDGEKFREDRKIIYNQHNKNRLKDSKTTSKKSFTSVTIATEFVKKTNKCR
jgi:hypothetical protein